MTRLILHIIWIFSIFLAVAEGICCPWSISHSFKYKCEDGTTVDPWQCCSTDTCNIFCCNCDQSCGQPGTGCTGGACCTLYMTPEESVANCCNEKTVGATTYTLVPGLPDKDTHPNTAIDGCVYRKKGESGGNKFAFAHGDLAVECNDQAPVEV
eukprot:GFUD01116338.1.p1 GENE.GFUD01116338.1~~GFUD01116338.1.p1  ORF type:complete len:154 (+),score=12.12 GFUD01116338.1:25-486(+)